MPNAFEKKQKEYYQALKPVFCPALQEDVYFNATGFNHLMYDDRRPRNVNERHYRLSLLPYVHDVIANAKSAVQLVMSENPPIVTWSMSHKLIKTNMNGKECPVKVIVIRNKPTGKLYFLSAMCKGKCKDKKRKFALFSKKEII